MAVVTFTTDFGTRDGYAGAMKGVVLRAAPDATLVDVTHDIPARDVVSGAFTLAQAAPFFPPGSIHVAVVDPGVGGPRADLVVEASGAYFVGPDNGLLSLAARGPRRVFRIDSSAFRRDPASPTFHGRDVFAAAAGRLAAGRAVDEAGPEMPDIIDLTLPRSGLLEDGGEGEVVHVDTFGNLITSFVDDDEVLAGDWDILVPSGRFQARAGRTFSDVPSGAFVVYAGSGGQVEIAVRDGSAAAAMGALRDTRLSIRRQT